MLSVTKPLLATLVAGALIACAPRGQPVYNVENAPYGLSAEVGTRDLSMRRIEQAIVRAGSARGWIIERRSVGHLEGGLTVRGKHNANVDIYYDREAFSIVRKSTSGLKYDPAAGTIHKNYNKWIRILEQEIRQEIQLARAT